MIKEYVDSAWHRPARYHNRTICNVQVEHFIDLSDLTCSSSQPQQLLADRSLQTGLPWIYVGDAATRSMLVYDVGSHRGHRVVLPKVVDEDGPRDVLYLSLVQSPDLRKRVYFTYLSSNR